MTPESSLLLAPLVWSLSSLAGMIYGNICVRRRESRNRRRRELAEAQGVPRGVRSWLAWWDDGELRKIVRESCDPAVPDAARLEWDRRQLVRPAMPLPATESAATGLLRAVGRGKGE